MSVSGILSSVMSSVLSSQSSQTQSTQNPRQEFQQEFQQLGADLQSGNLSAAQSDFATLQQNAPAGSPLSSTSTSSSSTTQGSNSLSSMFNQLSQDLQSGNLSGAQSDFSSIKQDLQSHAGMHHHGGGAEGANGSGLMQEFQQLGQALQSGSLSNAQQAYTSLQQDLQQFGAGQSASSSQTPTSSISVNV
ncbi:MAG TPA: hypothetical protein VHX49_12560 [Candidatus Acidoferrales bacterium]|jgi:hypothetical protein|nr:hypothetical protein [Candidatus Acidoferrales bacterium]